MSERILNLSNLMITEATENAQVTLTWKDKRSITRHENKKQTAYNWSLQGSSLAIHLVRSKIKLLKMSWRYSGQLPKAGLLIRSHKLPINFNLTGSVTQANFVEREKEYIQYFKQRTKPIILDEQDHCDSLRVAENALGTRWITNATRKTIHVNERL